MTTERNIPVLYLVIPCYNEEAVLPETTKRLTEKMHTMIRAEQVDPESRILYVDDGSKDKTWAIISEYAEAIPYVDGVKLAHNRGHKRPARRPHDRHAAVRLRHQHGCRPAG